MNIEKLYDTPEEEAAIKSLERALKKCSKLGIKFTVMGNELHYANKNLYKDCLVVEVAEEKRYGVTSGVYPTIAYAQNTNLKYIPVVDCHGTMDSCGGW